jgi:mRNA-degrading endonuclease RelE of RelBE toxin-antitoxin system
LPYKVILTKDAANDFRSIDGSVKQQVAKQLRKLESSPFLGDPLGNVRGFDKKLSLGKGLNVQFHGSSGTGKTMASEVIAKEFGLDLYKIYAAKKAIRIVYRIIENDIIVEIVGIGKRAEFEVYADVARRLLKKK